MSRRRTRPESEALLRERAYTDFLQMGIRRSVNGLLESYKVRAAEQGPATVPTLNRSELYRWAREDGWDTRVAEHDSAQLVAQRRSYDQTQRQLLDSLADLSPLAVGKIHWVLTSDDAKITPTHLLRAAELIVDRLGVTNKTAPSLQSALESGVDERAPAVVDAELAELYDKLVKNR